jgi:Cu(I)/Ag(I) efflux system membrane fusion protein
MFVRAIVHSSISQSGDNGGSHLLVPASAVLRTGKRAVIYVKKQNTDEPTFEGREIVIGARAGDNYVVISGLKEGEEVVIKGNFKIDSAMQIFAKPSMMNPEGGIPQSGHEHHNRSSETTPAIPSVPQQSLDTSKKFLEALSPLYTNYLQAQIALAEDDFEMAKKSLVSLDNYVRSIQEFNLSESENNQWDSFKRDLQNVTQHALHWSDIDAARKSFESISNTVIAIENTFGHVNEQVFYKSFCPMAFDNQGAFWIQTEEIINNPYFGASMLRCGEIKSKMNPKVRNDDVREED